ncbi:uncharacterized protein VTP21DRAFT_6704 [Calcarisporiella thermophila]|uniref:uncharacterized protein n=1 Tax=Calcarisporiella thermophila TaxID=911321 RepID=UPI0037421724
MSQEARSLYRRLWRAGHAAVSNAAPAKYIFRRKLRDGFNENLSASPDQCPILFSRAHNTLLFLDQAARRRGLEHKVIKNLCQMGIYHQKYAERPPFWNRKLKPHQHKLHAASYDGYYRTIEMLNESLGVFLR